jgi:hypothetical protein
MQSAFGSLEPAAASDLPSEVPYESESYRRLGKKTPQEISTRFGKITVHRLGYRAAPDVGEPVLFPLLRELGIVHGATPALVERVADYRRAYEYLRKRRGPMRYDEYRRVGMPIGSGVTEAACKTVYTQRLKLAGMRWKKAAARTIWTLRVILLSGVWSEVYRKTLEVTSRVQVGAPEQSSQFGDRIAG